ncbi:MFS transporter [Halotalea alkalilenta]|uniref:Transporter n=1 Tax=Halotalea alkalilenta TaxID=376489 RepID=A0A172YAY4_9GAMM|nr:MFS transporter [Halotalea alkalilenta]ANF56388.1 transporter [Halotalea alkalilenta]
MPMERHERLADSSRMEPVLAEVGAGFMLRYTIASFGLFLAVMTPVTITMAIRVAELDPTGKAVSLGFILGAGALVAMVANPLFGQLSDRTRSRFGRRRPWMFGGLLVGVLGLAGIGASTSLWWVGVLWCVVQAGLNATLSALIAVIPDRVPEQQRGRVSAFYGMSSNVAVFSGAAIVDLVGAEGMAMFLVPALIGLGCMLLFALRYPEPEVAGLAPPKPFSTLGMLRDFWLDPRQHPDFAWAWVSRFLLFIGGAMLMTYQVYYLTDVLGIDALDIGRRVFVSSLVMGGCMMLASFISGWLSDRSRRRKPFVLLAGLVYAAGLGILTVTSSFTGFLAAIVVSSLGFGVYLAVDQALVVDILPNREQDAAKNMGILNIANAAPQSLAPAVAPLFLAIGGGGNYVALFITAAALALVGALAILPVKGVR